MTKTEFIEFYKKEVSPYLEYNTEYDTAVAVACISKFPDDFDLENLRIKFVNKIEEIKLREAEVNRLKEALNAR